MISGDECGPNLFHRWGFAANEVLGLGSRFLETSPTENHHSSSIQFTIQSAESAEPQISNDSGEVPNVFNQRDLSSFISSNPLRMSIFQTPALKE